MLLLHVFLYGCVTAQNKPSAKFGKISPADFDLSQSTVDPDAGALVIADIGESHYEGVNIRGMRLMYNHYKRAKILKKSGFAIADVTIPYFSNGTYGQKIYDLKANTYNLENGQVTQIKLDDKSVFTENFTGDFFLKKFTFPGVKEGSIIEYSYEIESSPQINLQSWEFQGRYPCLWSEYNISIPELFHYVTLEQGYNTYFINTTTDDLEYGFKATQHHWVMKDIAALNEEKFITTTNNYISKIEFQLSTISQAGTTISILPNWSKITESMMENEKFGAALTENNKWLDETLKPVIQKANSKLEKAENIYAFVRNNFKCTQNTGMSITNSLKKVFTDRSGNEAEINLLLSAMLNHEELPSDPIILSTRQNGYTNGLYPMMNKFNYVVCDVKIGADTYLLDASQQFLTFNHLPAYCYNGQARLINKDESQPIDLNADLLQEKTVTSVFIINDDKNTNDISGSFQCLYGYYGSYNVREEISKNTEKDFFKNLKSSSADEMEIQNPGVDSLNQLENPVTVHYDFYVKNAGSADIVYFNPVVAPTFKDNPLKSMERKYPVEMPYTTDEVYLLDMEIPKGFVVNEIPKSEKVSLNQTDGFFEYIIESDETSIHLRSHIKINKATFTPEEYHSLRDFFAYVIKKQTEQIVFKKKK